MNGHEEEYPQSPAFLSSGQRQIPCTKLRKVDGGIFFFKWWRKNFASVLFGGALYLLEML